MLKITKRFAINKTLRVERYLILHPFLSLQTHHPSIRRHQRLKADKTKNQNNEVYEMTLTSKKSIVGIMK